MTNDENRGRVEAPESIESATSDLDEQPSAEDENDGAELTDEELFGKEARERSKLW